MSDKNGVKILAELHYKDPVTALDWLNEAFGFETRLIVKNADGVLVFAESGWGENTVAILPEESDLTCSPASKDGINTQTVRIRSDQDVVAHCAKAKAAGARIVTEPEQYFFGDLTYQVADIEGHIWAFAQPIAGSEQPPPEGWTISFPSRQTDPR